MPKVIVNSTPLIALCGIGQLIDDNAAKKTAKYLRLTVTGTLGGLLKAKHQGLIDKISPLLFEMRKMKHFLNCKYRYLDRQWIKIGTKLGKPQCLF